MMFPAAGGEFLPRFMTGERAVASPELDLARLAIIYRPSDDEQNMLTANAIQKRLLEAGHEVIVHASEPDIAGNLDLVKDLERQYQPSTLSIIGGDGTESNFLSAVYESALDTPVWLIPGGSINDLTHMLYGSYNFHHPEHALHHGRLARLHPLQVRMHPQHGADKQVNVWAYYSLGLTADIAGKVNSKEHRSKRDYQTTSIGRLLVDSQLVTQSLPRSQRFVVAEGQEQRSMIDLVLTNGSKMAGKVHFKDIHLLRPEFGRVELDAPTKAAMTMTIAKARWLEVQKYTTDKLLFHVELDANGPDTLSWQRDGEEAIDNDRLTSGTIITAAVANRGLRVHTKRRQS